MGNPPGSFIWYELLTTDLAAAADFYAAVAGLTIPREAAPGPMDYRMIGTPGGGNVGGAMQLPADMREHGARPMWLGYFYVPDLDGTIRGIEAAGGSVQMPATDIPQVGRIAMVADPQGAPFYIMTPTPPEDDADKTSDVFDPEKPGHVAWNELHTRDAAAALDFYEAELGLAKSDTLEMGPAGTYRMFKPAGTDRAIGGMMDNPHAPHPMWMFYFNVPDIDEAHRQFGAAGGFLIQPPMEIPGGAYVTFGTDPQGAMFAVVGPRKEG